EVQVRSLTGESIRVPLENIRTIRDLELFLKQTFAPASSSPNFHMFHQGVKLSLETPITDSFSREGEFLALVPFVKKSSKQTQNAEPSEVGKLRSHEALESKLADSAWSDLMEDLSSLRESSDRDNAFQSGLKATNQGAFPAVLKSKVKKELHSSDALLSILLPSSGDAVDAHAVEKLIELMHSSSCLRISAAGCCTMSEANALPGSESDPRVSNTCCCPLWLKAVLWTFCFVNAYCACLQLWQKKITSGTLKRAIDKFSRLEFHPGFVDLKLLSEVFPEVICFVDDKLDAIEIDGVLMIPEFSIGKDDQDGDKQIT
ncbi:hypothetical protein M569_11827, partial [Genlisea aurea]